MTDDLKLDGALSPEELKKQVEPDPKVRALTQEVKDLKATIDSLRLGEGQLQALGDAIIEHIPIARPPAQIYIPPKEKRSVDSPISVVCHNTDWHYGEYQNPDEVEGFGEFSCAICKERILNKFNPGILDWVELHRKSYTVNELVMLYSGDMISGDIHQELKVTNEIPSTAQAVEVAFLIEDQVLMLAPHFDVVRVEFIVADNHSRLTAKPQAKEAGLNSFNYMTARMVQRALRDVENVQFNYYPMLQKTIAVQNMQYLCMHGHQIKGWAGYPYYGIDRQAGKESMRRSQKSTPGELTWEQAFELWKSLRFNKMVLGHFHAPLDSPWWCIGGSVSGTSAYDHQHGRYSPPCQTAWFVHPKKGEFDRTVFDLT